MNFAFEISEDEQLNFLKSEIEKQQKIISKRNFLEKINQRTNEYYNVQKKFNLIRKKLDITTDKLEQEKLRKKLHALSQRKYILTKKGLETVQKHKDREKEKQYRKKNKKKISQQKRTWYLKNKKDPSWVEKHNLESKNYKLKQKRKKEEIYAKK